VVAEKKLLIADDELIPVIVFIDTNSSLTFLSAYEGNILNSRMQWQVMPRENVFRSW
jgi:hypothetical protein